MEILVIGGTRFFGKPMVSELLAKGHDVTIATRGRTADGYGDKVKRIILDRTSETSMRNTLDGRHYDVVIDKIAYGSNDIRYAMETVAWCDRGGFSYDEVKRQAECALWQVYADRNWIAVRYPFVIGKDDYTKRLFYYVEHTMKSIPMKIDNPDCQMGFIRSDEAGRFMAFLADKDVNGAVNGCAEGTISIREIIAYVEKKTGAKAVIDIAGEDAPYNGTPAYSINTRKARALFYLAFIALTIKKNVIMIHRNSDKNVEEH